MFTLLCSHIRQTKVEKFMALMHLRLEIPGNMDGCPSEFQSDDETTTRSTVSCEEQSQEDTSGLDGAGSPNAEFHRVPSMNLATDPGAWVGDMTLSTSAGDGRTSSGAGNNPFDFSSDEEDDDETAVSAYGGDGEVSSSPETPARQGLKRGSNPFDFSFYDNKKEQQTRGDGLKVVDETPRTENVTLDVIEPAPRPSRICQLYPAAPSPTVFDSTTQDSEWLPASPCSLDERHSGLLPISKPISPAQSWDLALFESPSTPSTDIPLTTRTDGSLPVPSPASAAEGHKSLPPTPLLAFDGDVSCPSPTPPVTPSAIPPSVSGPVDLLSAVRDNTKTPAPADIGTAAACAPDFHEPHASGNGANSSQDKQQFNPFARPGSFVLADTPNQQATAATEKVRETHLTPRTSAQMST